MEVKRTEQIWLKPDRNISSACHFSKNLYNEVNYIIRQGLFNDGKWVRYNELCKLLNQSENYRTLPTQTSQQILMLLDKSWKSYFGANKDYKMNPGKYKEKPKFPKYKKKNGEHVLIFTNQNSRIKNGVVSLCKKIGLKMEVKTRIENKDLKQMRILPKGTGYVLEIVYKKDVNPVERNSKNVVGIDFGCANIITMVNNIGKEPIVVKDNGNGIKSTNQYFNKEMARLQNVYDSQNIKTGKVKKRVYDKRECKVNDYVHKISRFIVNYCLHNDIGTIVFGYNPNWKQRVNIGKRNNQIFTQIPYMKIIEKTEYKSEEEGIEVLRQEESHTSKCSFLDNETVEHHKNYLGKRFTRSLFRSANGSIIHSDVNAGYNILRKAIPKAFSDGCEWIGGCGLHPVKYNILFN